LSFVVDASVILTMAFEEERVDTVARVWRALESEKAMVPGIFATELANALAIGERRKRITGEKVKRFVEEVARLPIEADTEGTLAALTRALPIARTLHLTAYDALYLELAERLELPLATLDKQLAAAAKKTSIELMLEQ
jgi:predicted nucleic acid-binding protein